MDEALAIWMSEKPQPPSEESLGQSKLGTLPPKVVRVILETGRGCPLLAVSVDQAYRRAFP
jgi:hypothetical protein